VPWPSFAAEAGRLESEGTQDAEGKEAGGKVTGAEGARAKPLLNG